MKLPRALCILAFPALACAGDFEITVNAGAHERSGCIVSFHAPPGLQGVSALKSEDGTVLPLQMEGDRAFFIEPRLGAGATKTYTLAKSEAVETIRAESARGALRFSTHGKPMFTYQMEPGPTPEGVPPIFAHGAHLHPVFSPGGRLVTADHPADHRWHRGIWMAWTKTEFEGRHPDFWNMGKAGETTLPAEVRFAGLDRSWSGPVQGGFVSRHRFIDHSGGAAKDVLNETWEAAAYRLATHGHDANVIDLVSTQTCASAAPLKLPKYHYGGLGVRGNQLWNAVNAVTMLTSNGDNREKGDATKSKWVHLGGEVDDAPTGLIVLIHPSNFRFPQPLRLNPKNPQLCVAPSQDGDWSIEPGRPYVSRYRIVIADGPPDAAWIERLWQDYAEPATALTNAK